MDFTDTPNAPNIFGDTPIHEAARNGHLDVVKFLVDFTDTPNAPNMFGNTPIQVAKRFGHVEVNKSLEKYCINPRNQSKGQRTGDCSEIFCNIL